MPETRPVADDHGYTHDLVTAYRAEGDVDPDVIAQAVDAVQDTLRPAGDKAILMELARLETVTAQRRQDDIDRKLRMDTMLRELQQYPADVVLDTLHAAPRYSPWFPTLAGLMPALQRETGKRTARLRALERLVP